MRMNFSVSQCLCGYVLLAYTKEERTRITKDVLGLRVLRYVVIVGFNLSTMSGYRSVESPVPATASWY